MKIRTAATAALTLAAAFLGAGQAEVLAQHVQQAAVRADPHLPGPAVDDEGDVDRGAHSSRFYAPRAAVAASRDDVRATTRKSSSTPRTAA